MVGERLRAVGRRRRPTWSVVALVVVLVAAGCSDDDDGGDSAPPVATVHGVEISESDVEALASDAGFREFIGAPEPVDEGAEVSQTDAGRRALTWLIGKALIDSELEVQELEIDRDALKQAEDDLEAGEVPDDVNAIVDGEEELGRDAADEVAEALAAYVTLDEALRAINPDDTELHDRILDEHPEVTEAICGSALSVDEKDAAKVRDQLKGGSSLDEIADGMKPLSRTPAGGECLTRGRFRRQLVDLLYGTPVGSAGEKTIVSRTTGEPVVFFVAPSAKLDVASGSVDAVVADTLQRLHDDGGAAFAELAYSTVDPNLDASWGTWDPTVGVVAEGAEPAFTTFDLPDPTTTTTAPPPPPPPPEEPSQFAEESEPTLAGPAPGDPGTSDLVARSQAALNSIVPEAWRKALPVTLTVIGGSSSLSGSTGTIKVASVHASGDWNKLQAVMAHEFGHQVGFFYGSQAEPGAAPTGWPPSGVTPAVEGWGDCVSAGYIPFYQCGGSSQPWTVDWMGVGPAAHPRTA